MAESPDFESIARQLDADLDDSPAGFDDRYLPARLKVIAEQLRLVWNARGAADMAAYRSIGNSSPLDIVRALRSHDR